MFLHGVTYSDSVGVFTNEACGSVFYTINVCILHTCGDTCMGLKAFTVCVSD